MLSKDIMQEYKSETKNFKTTTGSPITYAKLRKKKGMYYPMAKPHLFGRKEKLKNHHVCVVYSKMYGREVYENIDIWPDDIQLMKDKHAVIRVYENIADIPDTLEESDESDLEEHDKSGSTGDVHADVQPPADEKKHVTIKITDASDEETQSSVGDTAEISRPESPSSQSGQWPLKRSQSVDSRDNPFLPGGNLSKEAEDILARATIIRDTFILPADGGGATKTSPEKNTDSAKTNSPNAQTEEPVTETMTTALVKNTEASVPNSETSTDTRHKENGQLDTENSLTPGSVKVEIVEECRERKKQQKCCAVM